MSGLTRLQLLSIGYTDGEILAAGIDAATLYSFGYTANQLLLVGYTINQLKGIYNDADIGIGPIFLLCQKQASRGRTRMCLGGSFLPQPTKLGSSMNNNRESCRMRYADNIRNSTNKTFIQGKPVHVNQSVNSCINTNA